MTLSLSQPLNDFISQQIKSGAVASEVEAEQLILSAVTERAIDRKIARAEQQIENDQFKEANDKFVEDFITRAKKRNNLK